MGKIFVALMQKIWGIHENFCTLRAPKNVNIFMCEVFYVYGIVQSLYTTFTPTTEAVSAIPS